MRLIAGGGVSPRFLTTSWSLVQRTSSRGSEGRDAWVQLCEAYWYPVYSHARRRGLRPEDAEDATQAFFAWVIEANILVRADRDRGRFRTFLLTAMNQFLIRRHERESAAKRRPAHPIQSLSLAAAESRYVAEPTQSGTAEERFDRAWALALIDRALSQLEAEWKQSGKGARFDALRQHLVGDESASLSEIAQSLSMTEGAVRVAVHRMRNRFGMILRQEVGRTLECDEEIDEELQYLRATLRS